MKTKNRQQYIYQAKMGEKAERFEEMAEAMKNIAQFPDVFSVEERNMLSVAYKNTIEPLRKALRVLNSLQKKEEWKGSKNLHILKGYKAIIREKLSKYCWEILGLIDMKFMEEANDKQSQVFFLKMKGNYNKYIAQTIISSDYNEAANNAFEAYKKASEIAEVELSCTNPVRLELALNYSTFLFEFMNDSKQACQLARKSFNDAVAGIEQIEQGHYKDATLVLSIMRDNLTLWDYQSQEADK